MRRREYGPDHKEVGGKSRWRRHIVAKVLVAGQFGACVETALELQRESKSSESLQSRQQCCTRRVATWGRRVLSAFARRRACKEVTLSSSRRGR